MRALICWSSLILTTTLAWAEPALITVPFTQADTSVPHPVHSGAAVTLKGIIRDPDCRTYAVRWDLDRDGDYDDEQEIRVVRYGNLPTIRDVGQSFRVPDVARSGLMTINVRARSECTDALLYGSYRLFVHDWQPAADPRLWTDEQIEVLAAVALDEVLWFLHRRLAALSGHDEATLRGTSNRSEVNALMLWLLAVNGHQPAFPPGSVQGNAQYPLPEGWSAANDARWRSDPYAETAARVLNKILRDTATKMYAIDAEDEADTCGRDADGAALRCARVPGTTDGLGLHMGSSNSHRHAYENGVNLGGLTTVLPALAGVPLPEGRAEVKGRSLEWVVQQMVDNLGAMQIDGGCARGGWYYHHTNATGCAYADASTAQWAFIGLESAEVGGRPYGIVVPNRIKERIADVLVSNQSDEGGARYRTSRRGSTLQLTGGAIVASRWLGAHHFAADDPALAFPENSQVTRGKLRATYDRYLSFTASQWQVGGRRGDVRWADSLWRNGDYLCGETDHAFDVGDRCGNSYAIYSYQKGFRTGLPELDRVGNQSWYRQFATYYVRAQHRHMTDGVARDDDYDAFGEIDDDYCGPGHSVACSYNRRTWIPIMAGLVLTPTIFSAKPEAVAEARPATVTAGCMGGQTGRVRLSHEASFHPNPDARIVTWQWDVDARDGLAWTQGLEPDYQVERAGGVVGGVDHVYRTPGEYQATLRVVDEAGLSRTSAVPVTVLAPENRAPSALAGGPYVLERGHALQLEGEASDPNVPCGDALTVSWRIGELRVDGASPVVPWAALAELSDGEHPVHLTVEDAAGETAHAETTLRIVGAEPVAALSLQPAHATCGQAVRFDATGSGHPNPARQIALLEWDVDGAPGADGAGARFEWRYDRFGQYPVRLRVVDDLGRETWAEAEVSVDAGNRPPVARLRRTSLVVPRGEGLVLDASGSTDPDAACGDAIAAWRWDLDGDGQADRQGARLELSPAEVDALAGAWRLTVVDSFGAEGALDVAVRVSDAAPVPVISQFPEPAPVIDEVASATLDARESRSPLPDGALVRFDWDLDDDGQFEVVDEPSVTWHWRAPVGVAPEIFVTVRVTDAEGRVSALRQRLDVRHGPVPPSADADPEGAPEPGYDLLLGDSLELDGSRSVDPQGARRIIAWRWDLAHDPEIGFEADIEADQPVVEVSVERLAELGVFEPGASLLALQVEDADGLIGQDVAPFTVHAEAPVATFAELPAALAPGVAVVLDGRAAHHPHPDVTIADWAWELDGDGAFDDATGAVVETRFEHFTFGEPIEVGLRITDTLGRQATALRSVRVDAGNRAPSAEAGGHRDADGAVDGPYVIAAGAPLVLSARGTVDPDAAFGDEVVSYRWSVNGTALPDEGAEITLPWAQLQALGVGAVGTYPVALTVTDRYGVAGEAAGLAQVVAGPPARIRAPGRAACGAQVAFDASDSGSDGPADQGFALVDYAWDLDGDGAFDDATGQQVAGAALARLDGPDGLAWRVALRVTDAAGRTDVAAHTLAVDVDNVPPLADAGGPYRTGPVGGAFAPIMLDGRGSFDANTPCDAVAAYRWDLDGDGVFGAADGEPEGATALVMDPSWQVGTARTVSLVACDAFGACSAPADAIIEVLGETPPTGAILSPTADGCVGAEPGVARVEVADPLGDRVSIELTVAGVVLAEARGVQTPEDGSAVEVALPFDPTVVPEGGHRLTLTVTDETGAAAVVRSAEAVVFDRQAPRVTFGAEPVEGACYRDGAAPAPDVEVDDLAAQVVTEVLEDGCARTLRVTATDACGNAGQAERVFLTAQPVTVQISGPEDGARAAQAAYEWAVDGPEACASAVQASYRVDGGPAVPYAEGEPILEGGRVVVTWRVANCLGLIREQVRAVEIGAGAVAVAVPPERRPVAGEGADDADYVVLEGEPLVLDGRASSTRGRDGAIVAWAWDFDGDDQPDAEGAQPVFPTDADGLFRGWLRVTDDLGAVGQVRLRVRVLDVAPTADAGGPYAADQGTPVVLDASASTGHAADTLRRYAWRFEGGETIETDAPRLTHVFEADGLHEVWLTVYDEDDSATARTTVQVADVDPVALGITLPDDPRELLSLGYTAVAQSGGAGDPITRYEWDFDGDGVFDVGGAEHGVGVWAYRAPGPQIVRLRVHDRDSFVETEVAVDLRECAFEEVLAWVGERVADHRNDPALPGAQAFALGGFDEAVQRALWGERYGHRGVTLLATERMVAQLRQAQGFGLDLGWEIFGLTRQLVREAPRHEAGFLADRGALVPQHPSVQRAQGFGARIAQLAEQADLVADTADAARSSVASEVQWASLEAYAGFEDAVDACAQGYEGFPMPNVRDPLARAIAANGTNRDVLEALVGLRGQLDAYLALGDAGAPAPGRARVIDARDRIQALERLVAEPVGILCDEGECISDREALDLLLDAADLLEVLEAARAEGAYVRQWQTCLAMTLRFRTELSILRTEYACGVHHPLSLRARANQSVGEALFESGDVRDALDHYADIESRCVMIETYNRCLVPHWPENHAVAYPEACLNN